MNSVRKKRSPRPGPGAKKHDGHCLRMLGALSDSLGRGAKFRLCRRIEEHLKECPDCRVYVDTLRKTVVLYRSLGGEDVPAQVEKRLFKTIRLAELEKAGAKKKPIAKHPL